MSPHSLPINEYKSAVLGAVGTSKVTVVIGTTGSGKSTYVPLWISQSTEARVKLICAQPRRVAAVSLAYRVAQLSGDCEVGRTVGYRIRGEAREADDTRIVYATGGCLRTVLSCDPSYLRDVTHIVLDEVHERTMDSDFLSLIIKELLTPEGEFAHIKLVVMSATIDAELFTSYFASLCGDSPVAVVEVPSATPYNIETQYLEDLLGEDDGFDSIVQSAIGDLSSLSTTDIKDTAIDLCARLALHHAKPGFTTLIFLPGEAAIAAIERRLVRDIPSHQLISSDDDVVPEEDDYFVIHVLHSLVPQVDQRKALKRPIGRNGRHIVLATNIAESSLTVEAVNLVIDSGLKKELVYDPQRKLRSLRSVWTSRASLTQRRGRTGRVCDGTVIRLFTRDWEKNAMTNYDVPEAILADPSRLFLSAKFICERWRRHRPSELIRGLISVDADVEARLAATVIELHTAGVLTDSNQDAKLTLFGSLATWLQLDPPVCKLVFLGLLMGVPVEGVVLAAATSVEKDPFKFCSKFQPGDEARFAQKVFASMRQRILYDLGLCSDLLMMRNLIVSWLGHRAQYGGEVGVYAAPFYTTGLFLPEFEAFRSQCGLIARGLEDWLTATADHGSRQVRDEDSVALSRERIDAIFDEIDFSSPDNHFTESEIGNRSVRQVAIDKLVFFGKVLNQRKRCDFTRSDLARVFLPMTQLEDSDVLKLIITMSLSENLDRVLAAKASFSRCSGEVFTMARPPGCTDMHALARQVTGGAEPFSVKNADKGVVLVSAGYHEEETIEGGGLSVPWWSEFSSVTTSCALRMILTIFEKVWKIDVANPNGGPPIRVGKPYVYNICRWMLNGGTRVYLAAKNPSAWLETKSGVYSDSTSMTTVPVYPPPDGEAASAALPIKRLSGGTIVGSGEPASVAVEGPQCGMRDNDGRRSRLARMYFAIPGRLVTSELSQLLRAEMVTVLPIRRGGRVAVSMLLCAVPPTVKSVRQLFAVDKEGMESVQIGTTAPEVYLSSSFPIWDELVEQIDRVRELVNRATLMNADTFAENEDRFNSASNDLVRAVGQVLTMANDEEVIVSDVITPPDSCLNGTPVVFGDASAHLEIDRIRLNAFKAEIELCFERPVNGGKFTMGELAGLVNEAWNLYDDGL